jgi:hypothetical protein
MLSAANENENVDEAIGACEPTKEDRDAVRLEYRKIGALYTLTD